MSYYVIREVGMLGKRLGWSGDAMKFDTREEAEDVLLGAGLQYSGEVVKIVNRVERFRDKLYAKIASTYSDEELNAYMDVLDMLEDP